VSGSAELVPDRGEAAAGPEFFRSTRFMAAEGVTHTLRIHSEQGDLLTPLVVREIPRRTESSAERRATSDERLVDATSPYGYPGFAGPAGLSLDSTRIEWSSTGLVSLFIRHRLGAAPPLLGATGRNTVQIADPALPRKSRPSDRQQIRRNLKRGYELRRVAGPEASTEERAGFLAAYEQTMRRTDAAERYFFGDEYFSAILGFERSWLVLALAPDGEVAAGSIAVQSDAMLHYFLSGTSDRDLRDSPMKNIVAALGDFGEELDLPLNLGGGVEPGDPLEEFKRGFANRTERFHTSELVCDAGAYHRLSEGHDAPGFFPAYRASPTA
jgi:hypothetical protein